MDNKRRICNWIFEFVLKRTIWFFITAFSVNCIFFLSNGKIPFIKFWGIWILFIPFVPFLLREINKQKLRNQPSWVFYFILGGAFVPLFWIAFSVAVIGLVKNHLIFDSKQFLFSMFYNSVYWLTGWLILYLLSFLWPRQRTDSLSNGRFAAGAVGIAEDKLDFKLSSENETKGLLELDSYINVVGLYGELGSGKSSFARMIVENFNSNDTLYTYLSLTETNEAKDFSKLFAERWLETLGRRYPRLDVAPQLKLMHSVLRESNHGFLTPFINLFESLNRGLAKTKIKKGCMDPYYNGKNKYFVSNEVAKLFCHIPSIKENLWLFMIDEIERAQFDEIYRVVEIIERFKNEGRSGLPVRIIFILCISRSDLEKLLATYKEKDVRAYLLSNFFIEDSKSITKQIFLPPIEPDTKKHFLLQKLKKVCDETNVLDLMPVKNIEDLNPSALPNPVREFIVEHKISLEYILGILANESPRIIDQSILGIPFFYNRFRDRNGIKRKDSILFCDVLALIYMQIKYPILIEFFSAVCGVLAKNSFETVFDFDKLREKKVTTIQYIEKRLNAEIPKRDASIIEQLVGLVFHCLLDRLNPDAKTGSPAIAYLNRTSDPSKMVDYLSVVSNKAESPSTKFTPVYFRHRDSGYKELKDFLDDNRALLQYSRFLLDLDGVKQELNLDIAKELAERILKGKFKLEPRNIGDTILDSAIHQLVFQIRAVTEAERSKNNKITLSEAIKTTFGIINDILMSESVSTGTKYIILNAFVNDQGTRDSVTHVRLIKSFLRIKSFYEKEMLQLIKHVFDETGKRYLVENRIIYENEENFFYVLYQGWSGNSIETVEIQNIRDIAKRGLEKYPDSVRLYWNQYPYEESWSSLEDVLEEDHFFEEKRNELYMPLKDLIRITNLLKFEDPDLLKKIEFWKKILTNELELYNNHAQLKNDPTTLKAVLMQKGFLQAKPLNNNPPPNPDSEIPTKIDGVMKSDNTQNIEEIILNVIRQKGQAKREDFLAATGMSKSSLGRLLDKMEEEGKIVQVGERKASHYTLSEKKGS